MVQSCFNVLLCPAGLYPLLRILIFYVTASKIPVVNETCVAFI